MLFRSIVQRNENVEGVMSTAGQGVAGDNGPTVGRLIVHLKPREERKAGADEVIQQIRRQAQASGSNLQLFLSNPPAIRLGGSSTTADWVYTLQGTDLQELYGPAQQLEARLKQLPMLTDVSSNLQLRNPEIQLSILRDRASDRKSTRLNSSHIPLSRMPSSA